MSETQAMTAFTGVQQTSFADRDAARGDKIPQYKGKEGVVDRIVILDPSILFVGRRHNHFIEGKQDQSLGYVLCQSTYLRQEGGIEIPDKIARCCQVLSEARKVCGTWIGKYSTDASGKPIKTIDAAGKASVQVQPMAWLFGTDKYDNLFQIHDEFAEKDEQDRV
jgi:hypothetical protein